ncbi:hypothetical protein IWQ60_010055 [Tieghemiomyces parasiticus]|uniref:Mid2 domain-containing protein n=1 Tax=Tieghemiomyces parasiticus TaxID=78921 RepID=A0A9W7ZM73_9FUNG|nr:hypothetical protein IWQ60_010055 [Tieghemiomyces parasiticus]
MRLFALLALPAVAICLLSSQGVSAETSLTRQQQQSANNSTVPVQPVTNGKVPPTQDRDATATAASHQRADDNTDTSNSGSSDSTNDSSNSSDSSNSNGSNNADNNNADVVTMTTIAPAPTDNSDAPVVVTIDTTVAAPSSKPTKPASSDNKEDSGSSNKVTTIVVPIVVVVGVVVLVAIGILVFRHYKRRSARQDRMKEALPQNFFSRTQESDAMFLRQLND